MTTSSSSADGTSSREPNLLFEVDYMMNPRLREVRHQMIAQMIMEQLIEVDIQTLSMESFNEL